MRTSGYRRNLINLLLLIVVSSSKSLNSSCFAQVQAEDAVKNLSLLPQDNFNEQFNVFDSPISAKRLLDARAVESGHEKKGRRHLVVATLESPPFMMKRQISEQSENNQTKVAWYGYCMDFFLELIRHLPYEVTFEIYQVSDNKFGSKTQQTILEKSKDNRESYVKVERWNGLVGDLKDKRAHLALAPMAVMAERELVVDFTVPFYDLVGIQILLKKPEVPRDWFKFLTVLDMDVWLSITLAYFLTSFVIYLFDRLSPYSHKNLRSRESHKPKPAPIQQAGKVAQPISFIGGELPPKLMSQHTNLMSYPHLQSRQISPLQFAPLAAPTSATNRQRKTSTLAANSMDLVEPHVLALKSRTNQLGSWEDAAPSDKTDESSEENDGTPDFGLRDSLWFCITSLTPQGGGEAPQNLSGRIVAGAWWLFCFIVIASYTANLAAFLTVSRLDIPIESLDDLAKQYRIKYAPVDGTAEQTYFERMAYIEEIFYNIWKEMSLNDSLSEEDRAKFAVWDYPISDRYTKIWSQIQEVGMPADVRAGLGRVKSSTLDDGFALLADANIVRHAVLTDCSLKAVGDEFSRKPIALAVQKGDTQLRDDVSFAVLQLINQRFMEVLREKWWTNNPDRVLCENHDESEGISIENIGGVFIIIVAGVALSFLVWALEKFVYKTKLQVSRSLIEGL